MIEPKEENGHMDDHAGPRIRKPVGAVLSVRVPRDLAVTADEFAREHSMTLSELVRVAVEDYLSAPPPRIRWTLYGSTIDANLLLSSPSAGVPAAPDTRALAEAIEDALRWFALADREQNVHRYREGVRILRAALSERGQSS